MVDGGEGLTQSLPAFGGARGGQGVGRGHLTLNTRAERYRVVGLQRVKRGQAFKYAENAKGEA